MSDAHGQGDTGEDLLERVAELARHFAEAESLDDTLQRIADRSEDYLESCDGASLMLIRGKKIITPAFSSKIAYESDMVQYETGEGPCLEALREHETIIIDDLQQEERWPDYRERALELGVRSMISFRLFVAGDTIGALDLYSSRPQAFGRQARAIGQVFAAHASVAMKAAIEEAGLEQALETRDVISQAKGMVMARDGVTADEAFQRLRGLAGTRNVKLRDLAARIAETGEIPD